MLIVTGVNILRQAIRKRNREIEHIIKDGFQHMMILKEPVPYAESEIRCIGGAVIKSNNGGVKPAVYMGG